MITGDKPNTAISIGRSTGIIDSRTKDSNIVKLDLTDKNRDYGSVMKYLKMLNEELNLIPQFHSHYVLLATCSHSSQRIMKRNRMERV